MKGKVMAVCGVIMVFGIISAIAGFAAEATKVKASEVYIYRFSCVYPSSPALGLGILAAVCTIITRILLFMLLGCCCRPKNPASTSFSNLFNILSWIISVIAVIILLTAAALNKKEGGETDYYGTITCYVVKSGIFAAGAVLSLLSAIFGIVAYISVSSATQTTSQLDFALPVASNIHLEKSPTHPQQ